MWASSPAIISDDDGGGDGGDGGGSENDEFLRYDNVLRGSGRLGFRFRELRGLFHALLTPHGFYL